MKTYKNLPLCRNAFFASLALLFFYTSIATRIPDKRDLKGLYDAVIDEKKYLSPFHGFVFVESGVLEKYYTWGNATVEKDEFGVVTKVIKADNTMTLIFDCFHLVGGQFGSTKVPTKIAAHFTADIIGKLLAKIDEFDGADEKEAKVLQKSLAAIILSAAPAGKITANIAQTVKDLGTRTMDNFVVMQQDSDPEMTKILQKTKYFQFTPQQWKRSLKNLADAKEGFIEQLFEPVQSANKAVYITGLKNLAAELKQLNTQEEQNKKSLHSMKISAVTMAKNIVGALRQAGHIGQNPAAVTYPHYMPHLILLSLLYDQSTTKNDFIAYFDQFDPTILRQESATYLAGQLDPEIQKSQEVQSDWTRKPLEEITAFLEKNYEQLAYEAIFKITAGIPPRIRYGNPILQGIRFANCGEAEWMNFIRLAFAKIGIYDPIKNSFNAQEIIPKVKSWFKTKNIFFDEEKFQRSIQPIITFFTTFHDATIDSGITINDMLVGMLSDIPNIKYQRGLNKKQFEFSGCPDNFFIAFNYFFGTYITSFKELCTIFDIILHDEGKNITDKELDTAKILKPTIEVTINGRLVSYKISFEYDHVDIEFANIAAEHATSKILGIALKGIKQNLTNQMLIACYPNVSTTFKNRLNDVENKKIESLPLLMYMAMTVNMANEANQTEIAAAFIEHSQINPHEFFGQFTNKFVNLIEKSKNLISLNAIMKTVSGPHCPLSTESLAILHRCAVSYLTNKNFYKKCVYDALFNMITKPEWKLFEHNQHFIKFVELLQNFLAEQSEKERQDFLVNTLQKIQLTTVPPALVQFFTQIVRSGFIPSTTLSTTRLPDIFTIVVNQDDYLIALLHLGQVVDEKEKNNRIKILIPEIGIFASAKLIIEENYSPLYSFIKEEIENIKLWKATDYMSAEIVVSQIIEKYPHEEKILDSLFFYILSYSCDIKNIMKDLVKEYFFIIDTVLSIRDNSLKNLFEKQMTKTYPFIEKAFEMPINTSREIVDICIKKQKELLINFINYYKENTSSILPETTAFIKTCIHQFFVNTINYSADATEAQELFKTIQDSNIAAFNEEITRIINEYTAQAQENEHVKTILDFMKKSHMH